MQKHLFLLLSCFIFGPINAMNNEKISDSDSEKAIINLIVADKLVGLCDNLVRNNLFLLVAASNHRNKLYEKSDKQKAVMVKGKSAGLAPKPISKRRLDVSFGERTPTASQSFENSTSDITKKRKITVIDLTE